MNTNILKKCVEELRTPSPKIDYVLGMLESVIELSGTPIGHTTYTPTTVSLSNVTSSGTTGPVKLDEEEGSGLLKSYLGGGIGKLE